MHSTQQLRNVLLFLRKHHQFFGWLVVITAVAHTAYFLSFLSRVSLKMLITGIAALLILVLSLCYGLWIEHAVRKKRVAKNARIIHAIAAIAFFVAFLLHIGLGR